MGKRFAIVIGVAAAGVMALGAQTAAATYNASADLARVTGGGPGRMLRPRAGTLRRIGFLIGVALILALGLAVPRVGASPNELLTYNSFSAAARQPDGKIVALGGTGDQVFFGRFLVARFTNDGRLDPTFGDGDGIVTAEVGEFTAAVAVEVLPDGRLLIGGTAYFPSTSSPSFSTTAALVRLLPDGSLDPSLDGDGIALIPTLSVLHDFALQGDGKVLAVGWIQETSGLNYPLTRVNPNGAIDQTFGGGDGIVRFPGEAGAVLPMADGRILVGGSTSSRTDPVLVRYLADGSPDGTFGDGDGEVITLVQRLYSAIMDLAIDADGTITASGYWGHQGRGRSFSTLMVLRYRSDGAPDTGFGDGDGQAGGSCGNAALIALRRDYFLTAGAAQEGGSGACVERYPLDGSGIHTVVDGLEHGGPGLFEPSDAFVVIGWGPPSAQPASMSAAIARYLPGRNSLDPRFGLGGVMFIPEIRRCLGQPISAAGTDSETVFGTPGPDVLLGTSQDDEILTFGGDDLICTGAGDDEVRGGNGADRVQAGWGSDLAVGGSGADRLDGRAGEDRLLGGPGADLLIGGTNDDFLSGGPGLDRLFGGRGEDVERE